MALECNLSFLKVSLQFLEFYLCYVLLKALLRRVVKPNRLLVCSQQLFYGFNVYVIMFLIDLLI